MTTDAESVAQKAQRLMKDAGIRRTSDKDRERVRRINKARRNGRGPAYHVGFTERNPDVHYWRDKRQKDGQYTVEPDKRLSNRDNPDLVCGAVLPRGGTCRNWKGFRTDHPGVGSCRNHEASAPG